MSYLILSFIFLSSTLMAYEYEIDLKSKTPLSHFVAASPDELTSYQTMKMIFTNTELSFHKLLHAIKIDIIRYKKYIKKHTPGIEQQQLIEQLNSFFEYIKKHKNHFHAIKFHHEIRCKYEKIFDNQNILNSLHENPTSFGISEKCKYKYKTYFNQILYDLSQISKFEDYLHADYEELKAHNYVLKIELIKIRNFIYHHNRYKYETSYF